MTGLVAGAVHDRIDERFEGDLEALLELIRQPSVSATGEGMTECAQLVADRMGALGLQTEILDTGHHPIVWGRIGSGAPHLVLYGHYDVQPAGDLGQWASPPFEPVIRDGAIWARGAGDNKGQFWALLCALAAWQDVHGAPPPFTLTVICDGEDEIGGMASRRYIAAHPERFRGDFLLCADASTMGVEQPALFLGCRGAVAIELTARGAEIEWHSASYAGVLPNPAQRMACAVAHLADGEGVVSDPAFHRSARPVDERLREYARRLPAGFLDDPGEFGVDAFATGDARETMFFGARACLTGIAGGYQGEGPHATVPTSAFAKFDVKLAAGQHPDEAAAWFRARLDDGGFGDVAVAVMSACPGSEIAPDNPLVVTTIASLEAVWGVEPVVFPSIGGGGIFGVFVDDLGMPCLIVPYGQADLQEHSAHEHLSIEWFRQGIHVTAELLARLAAGRTAA
jgi:acetylornithine deacetylase/succinyl-diaminopimelate desuccinylase-like protein